MRDLSRRSRRSLCCRAVALTVFAASTPFMVAGAAHAQAGWTWTLYPDANPVVLAQEIPDTPELKTTFECDNGTGRVRISLYDLPQWSGGHATLRSGRQTAMTEIEASRHLLRANISADHPVFMAFQANGQLVLSREAHSTTVTLEPEHLGKLRRFAELCTS